VSTTFAAHPVTAKDEWKKRWPLVLAAITGFSFHSIMTSFSGLFIGPIGEEFSWSRTQVTAGLSLGSILGTVLSPFFGVLIDRWGTRRLALPGIVMKSLVLASFAFMSHSVAHWMLMWIAYAVTSLFVKSTIWTTAVAGVFTAGRGLAMGAVMSGTAIAQILVPPLANWLIDNTGWRGAFAWLGLGWGSVAFVLCLLFLYDAHDDAKAAGVDAKVGNVELPGLTRAEAWRDSALWRIAISTFLIMVFTIALTVHQIPILTEHGVSRTNAAWLASLAGASGIAGKLSTGFLIDRYRPNIVGGVILTGAFLGFMLLLPAFATPTLIVIAMLINGFAAGTKLQICAYMTSRYAGLKNFGTIFSIMASLIALASGLGPVLGGIVYDTTGSYTYFLIGGIICSIISGSLIFGLKPYPIWETAPAPSAGTASSLQPT